MIVRRAVSILSRQLQRVRSTVGWTGTTLVRAVLANQQPSGQRMIRGRKADGITVAVSPRERLDRGIRLCRVQPRAQDGAVADAMMRCTSNAFTVAPERVVPNGE